MWREKTVSGSVGEILADAATEGDAERGVGYGGLDAASAACDGE